jgi:hypothetical protein
MKLIVLLVVLFCCLNAVAEEIKIVGVDKVLYFDAGLIDKVIPKSQIKDGGIINSVNFAAGVDWGGVEIQYDPVRAPINVSEECLSQMARQLKVQQSKLPFHYEKTPWNETIMVGHMRSPEGELMYATEFRPPNDNNNTITVIVTAGALDNILTSIRFEDVA